MNTALLNDLIYSIVGDVPDSLYNRVDEDETGKSYLIITKNYTARFHIDSENKVTDVLIKRINGSDVAKRLVQSFMYIDSITDDEKS